MASSVASFPSSRQPRGILKVNGVAFQFVSWEIDSNTHYTPDTFRTSIPLGGQPKGYDAAWWSSQTKLSVQIYAGFPADPNNYSVSDLALLFTGRADDFVYRPAVRHIEISGRDRTAELINTKTTEKYANMTSSQIATKLAQNHGLTPVVTNTTAKVGRYYTQDYVRLQTDRTEWDLLTFLAREEGFECAVRGDSLYFQPVASPDNPYQFLWSEPGAAAPNFPAIELEFTHNYSLAKDIVVQVRSWDPKRKQGFTKTAKATHTKSPALKGAAAATYDVQTYTQTFTNLTPEAAQARANQILKDLTSHELKVSIEGPANNDLMVGQPFSISGTGTAYDQTYYPDSIVRSMDETGYRWTIRAKNHPVESDVAL
jgi:phage protein D